MMPFPLNTMVLNVTNQCNLSCTYCYEYGEDKIVDTAHGKQAKFMSEETARESVDFLLRESGRDRAPDVLRRRDAAELSGAAVDDRLRAAARGRDGQGDRLQPHDERDAAPAGHHRIPRREPRRRHDFDRRPARAAGQVPRVSQRRRQLRRRRAEDQGAAAAASQPADRRARDAHVRHARHHAHLPAPHRGDRLLGSRLRAGDDVAAAAVRDRRAGIRSDARSVPQARARVRRPRRREPASRVLEREGHARGDPQRREQGVSVRRRARPARRLDRRRRRALPSLRRLGRAQVRHGARRHRPRRAERVPRAASHRGQDRLQQVLGAAALFGRLLSRGARPLRLDRPSEPALLRVDSRLDGNLSRDLRRAVGAKSGISGAVRSRRGESRSSRSDQNRTCHT